VSPVKYEFGFYIPADDILHSYRRENVRSYIALTGWALQRKRNVSSVKYILRNEGPSIICLFQLKNINM
jgi:hypothetical protein